MEHDLRELNEYTGMFSAGCFLALIFCVYILGKIGEAIYRFHLDYRKVNSLDEREQMKSEL